MISAVAGAFDQHGRPLMVFPVDGQARLLSEVSSAEVVDFVNYFLYLHKYVDSGHVTPRVCIALCCLSSCVLGDLMLASLCRRRKKQEKERSVSVVADLRQTSLAATRFIAETLLLLEVCRPLAPPPPTHFVLSGHHDNQKCL